MECSPRKNGRNPNGFEILLIHGFPQSHLSWSRQFWSKLAHSYSRFPPGWELTPYLLQLASGLLEETGNKIATLWDFYLGPALTAPSAVMLPFVWRK